jgi:multimeric flavodoxin WrbA
MKKVLGIVASRRRSGNCEILVKEISRSLGVAHEIKLLRLPDFDLRYCTGCYRCLSSDGGCVIDDDLSLVLEAIDWADALILATPTYFLGAHASLKAFIDRAISFYGRADQLWGKPAVGIGVAGMDGKEGSTHLDIERFFSVLLAKNRRSRIVYGAYPGEVLLNEGNRKVVSDLASALFGTSAPGTESGCPVCAGETFRFMEGKKARCMLCSSLGTLSLEGDRYTFVVDEGEHQFLFCEAKALEHREWLKNMKYGYRGKKKELQKVMEKYEGTWDWINKE